MMDILAKLGSDLLLAAGPIVIGFIVALLGLGLQEFRKWIGTKTKNEYARGVVERLEDAINMFVRAAQQSVVDALKEASEDGKLDKADAKKVLDDVLDDIKEYLGEHGYEELKKVLGLNDSVLDKTIIAMIEAAVGYIKIEKGIADSANP